MINPSDTPTSDAYVTRVVEHYRWLQTVNSTDNTIPLYADVKKPWALLPLV